MNKTDFFEVLDFLENYTEKTWNDKQNLFDKYSGNNEANICHKCFDKSECNKCEIITVYSIKINEEDEVVSKGITDIFDEIRNTKISDIIEFKIKKMFKKEFDLIKEI